MPIPVTHIGVDPGPARACRVVFAPEWRSLALALVFLAALPAGAQPAQPDLSAARAVVDTLTAPRYHGRGFAYDGATLAARYLARQFNGAGLTPMGADWLHPFPFEADVITATPRLSMDGTVLALGENLLPYPGTASGEGEEVEVLDVGHGMPLPPFGNPYPEGGVQGRVIVFSEPIPEVLFENPDIPRPLLQDAARYQLAHQVGASAVVHLVDNPLFGAAFYDAVLPVFHVRKSTWTNPETVSFSVQADQNRPVTGYNVIGRVPGTAQPDSVLMLTAHYDGLGALGPEVYFPGANDNASGVALLLAVAAHVVEHPLPYTVVFAALGAEEVGLIGAQALAKEAEDDLETVRFLINFDMAASAEDGVLAFGGRDYPEEFDRLLALNQSLGLGPLAARANRPNSDHAVFLAEGVRGFYLLTKDGTQPYHSLSDRPETLEWDDFAHMYALVVAFLESF